MLNVDIQELKNGWVLRINFETKGEFFERKIDLLYRLQHVVALAAEAEVKALYGTVPVDA